MSTKQALYRYLRCVLPCGRAPVDYRSRLEKLQPVGELIQDFVEGRNKQWELLYCAHLVKNIILSQLRLLCLSRELEYDIEYAFGEYKALFKAAENFNSHVAVQLACGGQLCHISSLRLNSSNFIKVVLDCHVRKVTGKMLPNPNGVTVLHTIKFETGFLRALVGSLATHTSTFQQQKSVVYVSEEVFSLAEAETSWLDCLIPGAQSEVLRKSTQWMEAQLWRAVAARLVAAHQPLHLDSFAAALEEAAGQEELECHFGISRCLLYTTSSFKMLKILSLWDTGFQAMLAASREDTSRGYRGHRGATSTIQLLSNLVPTFKSSISHPSGSMVEQLNMLLQSHTVCSAIGISSRLTSIFLTNGLSTALCTWNLRVLAQLLFVDNPIASIATTMLTVHAGRLSPLITIPVGSPLCALTSCSCSCYELQHRRNISMKEAIGSDLLSFHDKWKARCAELLRKTFPPAKFWKVLGRKTELTQLSPSTYCQAITDHLLLPVIEAASALPLDAQRNFVYLTISVFVQQFRRTLTANKKTYRPAAGRQLLTDYYHLCQWLKSGEIGLHKETTQLLASLTTLAEVEHGLLTVCGTASPLQTLHTPANLQIPSSYSHLPVFVEQAWHSSQDWLECVHVV